MIELNSGWLEFLAQHGAELSDENPPQVLGFVSQKTEPSQLGDFAAPLTDLGLIELTGSEAGHFLHNQLTNDVEHLGSNEVRLAGYCSPKGRLLATLLYWRSDASIIVQLPKQILPGIQKRLQMYVLRTKAILRDASEDYAVIGLVGRTAATELTAWFPELPAVPYGKQETSAGTLIRLTDVEGQPRYQWFASSAQAIDAWPQLMRRLRAAGPGEWRLTNIAAGIPFVTQATQEQFVPQMINFDLIGGVNFKKGCYPGQEIVARSQYLGKIKRRMVRATVSGALAKPGMDVFSEDDPDQPCGVIVNAETSGADRMDCLVEIKVGAMEADLVHLGAATGAALSFKPLPYALPDSAV